MTAHVHAALMLQYAQDAMETDKPWERWEWFDDKSWYPCSNPPVWEVNMKYRRKPQTIKVGKWEFPKPIAFTPEKDTIYWVIRLFQEGFAPDDLIWSDDETDASLLRNNMIHLSREAAQAHADVLNAICRGDVE